MRPISAADAISPAFRRTREVFSQPFGTVLKISLVAALADAGCISAAVQLPIQGVTMLSSALEHGKLPAGLQAAMFVIPLVILLVLAVFWLVLGYIFTRLRFVVLDFVVRRQTGVTEAWRRYGPASWRYFGLNLLALVALMILLLSVAAPFLMGLLRAARTNNAAAILPHMFGLILGGMALSLLVQLVDAALRDFYLPQMALEDASIEQSTARCVALWRENPGEVILYLLLKVGLTIAFGIGLVLVVILCAGLIALGLAGVGFLLYHLLWAGGTGGRTVVIAYGILAGLLFLAIYLAGLIVASGINVVFRAAFASYFFGSRYTPLGGLLEPTPPAVAAPAYPGTALPLPLPPPVW